MVLGASGCGKSSLVCAGLVPRLAREHKGDARYGEHWLVPPPFKGGEGLSAGCANPSHWPFRRPVPPAQLAAIRKRVAPAKVGETGIGHAAHALLVVDQLEEVFGADSDSDAHALLALLAACSAASCSPLVTLATMRSDFLNALQLFPNVSRRYEPIPLDPTPKEHFGEVIEGPAARFGLPLDAGLTERLFPPVKVREQRDKAVEYRGVAAAIKHVANEILDPTGAARHGKAEPETGSPREA